MMNEVWIDAALQMDPMSVSATDLYLDLCLIEGNKRKEEKRVFRERKRKGGKERFEEEGTTVIS